MQEYKVDGHVSSFLPEGKKWKLVWNDEFDKTELDTTKWYFRRHLFGEEHKAYIENAISFDGNSNIIFHLVEKDGKYYSSTIQTGENFVDRPNGESRNVEPKFMHKYGYYEVRCILQKEAPWWSAFWLQSQNNAFLDDPKEAGVEIDIMESFTPNTYIPHCCHWGGYGENYRFAHTGEREGHVGYDDEIHVTPGVYHTFAVDWDKTGYTFYVDGKQCGRKIDGPVSDTEQFILLFTECFGYRKGAPYVKQTEFESGIKDEFIVDYVRVFDEVED